MSTADGVLTANPVVLAGPFGAGKTEMAVHLALRSAADRVVLVDLDLVTPYFRCRERSQYLCRRGVQLLAPARAGDAGLPVLPPGVGEAMNSADHCIVDVGGGESGVRVLGALRDDVLRSGASCFMVVNPFRPDSDSGERIARSVRSLERSARVRFAGIIANPHLGDSTTLRDISVGVGRMMEFGEEAGRPVIAAGVSVHVTTDPDYQKVRGGWRESGLEEIVIEPHMRAEWY